MYKIQTVYLPVKVEDELPKPSKYLVLKENGDKDFVYTPFSKNVTHWLKEQEVFVLTPEQLNEYTANVVRQALETAAENADAYIDMNEDAYVEGNIWSEVDKESITNTFEETFKKFEV